MISPGMTVTLRTLMKITRMLVNNITLQIVTEVKTVQMITYLHRTPMMLIYKKTIKWLVVAGVYGRDEERG